MKIIVDITDEQCDLMQKDEVPLVSATPLAVIAQLKILQPITFGTETEFYMTDTEPQLVEIDGQKYLLMKVQRKT